MRRDRVQKRKRKHPAQVGAEKVPMMMMFMMIMVMIMMMLTVMMTMMMIILKPSPKVDKATLNIMLSCFGFQSTITFSGAETSSPAVSRYNLFCGFT